MKKLVALLSGLCVVIALVACVGKTSSDSSAVTEKQRNAYEVALQQAGLTNKMEQFGVPGVSFAVIKNGKLDWAKGYGLLQAGNPEKVNTETMFSVGSVSKVGTAVVSLKLYEQGKVAIDRDVNEYLKAWKIPQNEHTDKQAVTLRHIMSHTAGLTVHGFADFDPDEELPNSVQILKGEWPAKNSRVYVNIPVGSRYRYSGGGTQIEQLLIEELTELPFHEAVASLLFQPLEMERSTYENPVPGTMGNIAKAHNSSGRPVALPRGYQSMPEAAASGLWTTPSDFAKLMIMLMETFGGKHSYLNQKTVKDMMTPVAPGTYGLGPRIDKTDGDVLFSHGGANESYRAQFIGSLAGKNGIVIFTNGTAGSELIDELLPTFEEMLF